MKDQAKQPLLFISHKHSDREIANTLREWLERWSLGAIEVYQTSAAGNAPQLGTLNDRLKEKLYEAQSVALIYTQADQDWSYCMWECGVAIDPLSPDTKIIPFQCSKDIPPPFAGTIRVKTDDRVSVHNFAAAFLTDPAFFPRYGRAVAPHLNPKSPQVQEAAEELFAKLEKVRPRCDADPPEEWPALAFIRFELDLESAATISNTNREGRSSLANQIISEKCIVSHSDYVAAGLFGLARINPGMMLDRLGAIWKDKNPELDLRWLESIRQQIILASAWEFPRVSLEMMRGDDDKWYVPQIVWVRKIPAQNRLYFDLHFFPVGMSHDGESINLELPKEGDNKS